MVNVVSVVYMVLSLSFLTTVNGNTIVARALTPIPQARRNKTLRRHLNPNNQERRILWDTTQRTSFT